MDRPKFFHKHKPKPNASKFHYGNGRNIYINSNTEFVYSDLNSSRNSKRYPNSECWYTSNSVSRSNY